MTKKIFTVLLLGFLSFASVFAQKFTKREQLRREAREKNYFCGNMFTFTAGFNHSWLTPSDVEMTTTYFGKTEKIANNKEAFNLGFLWDHAFKNTTKWSVQSGIYYTMKGGEHLYYYDTTLGEGPQLREEETEKLKIQGVEGQFLVRYAFPIAYDQRITLNAGPYITKLIDTPSDVKNWDFGALVGIGYDYKHWSASVNYQPGCFSEAIRNSKSRIANISINIGYRLWKK